jgi:hypothetical protein
MGIPSAIPLCPVAMGLITWQLVGEKQVSPQASAEQTVQTDSTDLIVWT